MAGSGDTARYEEHKRLFELSDRGCSNVGQTTEMSARSQISLLSSSIEDDKTKSKFKKAGEASLHKEGTQRPTFRAVLEQCNSSESLVPEDWKERRLGTRKLLVARSCFQLMFPLRHVPWCAARLPSFPTSRLCLCQWRRRGGRACVAPYSAILRNTVRNTVQLESVLRAALGGHRIGRSGRALAEHR